MNELQRARIDLSTRCNLHCIHCLAQGEDFSTSKPMPFSRVLEIVDVLARSGVKLVNILGLEPFLYPGVETLLEAIASKNLQISITTNGTVFTSKRIERITKLNLSVIYFSIEGATALVNDQIRGLGVFEKATQTLKQFIEQRYIYGTNTRFVINTVLNRLNYANMADMLVLCDELGVDGFNLIGLEPLGRAASARETLELTPDEQFCVAESLYAASPAYPNLSITILSSNPLYLEYFYRKYGVISRIRICGCKACRAELYIDSNGNMSPCLSTSTDFVANQKSPYQSYSASFEEYSSEDLEDLEVFRKFRHEYPLDRSSYIGLEPCNNCPYLSTICFPCPLLAKETHSEPLCAIAYSRGQAMGYWS